MGIDIQRDILGLKGQCVNQIKLDEEEGQLVICCRRDRRRKAIDPVTGQKGTVNRYVRRQVRDVPLSGYPCVIEMELAQVFISRNERRIESCEFVDRGWRFTRRCCRPHPIHRRLNAHWPGRRRCAPPVAGRGCS